MPNTRTKKPSTPKPHAMAFVGEAPCPICGCEWFRPTIRFVEGAPEVEEGSACANLWCGMIARLRQHVASLTADRLLLAKLAADTPQFSNPVAAWAATALRDKLLRAAPTSEDSPRG